MPVQIHTNIGKSRLVISAESPKEAFIQLASYSEMLAETQCGSCGSDRITFQARTVDNYLYLELQCVACGARFEFGQNKDLKNIFAKRNKGKRGWYHWEGP